MIDAFMRAEKLGLDLSKVMVTISTQDGLAHAWGRSCEMLKPGTAKESISLKKLMELDCCGCTVWAAAGDQLLSSMSHHVRRLMDILERRTWDPERVSAEESNKNVPLKTCIKLVEETSVIATATSDGHNWDPELDRWAQEQKRKIRDTLGDVIKLNGARYRQQLEGMLEQQPGWVLADLRNGFMPVQLHQYDTIVGLIYPHIGDLYLLPASFRSKRNNFLLEAAPSWSLMQTTATLLQDGGMYNNVEAAYQAALQL